MVIEKMNKEKTKQVILKRKYKKAEYSFYIFIDERTISTGTIHTLHAKTEAEAIEEIKRRFPYVENDVEDRRGYLHHGDCLLVKYIGVFEDVEEN